MKLDKERERERERERMRDGWMDGWMDGTKAEWMDVADGANELDLLMRLRWKRRA